MLVHGQNHHEHYEHRGSNCQFVISLTGIVVGALVTLSGIFAYCAIIGKLPPKPLSLRKFEIIGKVNSYFVMGGGGALTLLSIAALIHLFDLAGKAEHERKQQENRTL